MKILYIDVNCKNSSTGQIVYSLFSNCKKNGIDAAICYGRGPLIKENGIYKFGLDIETIFHAFMTRITGYTGCFSFFSTRRLIRYIKHFNPDVVHIHELHAYFVNIKPLLKYLRKNNINTVFTNHCEFLYTGKCGHSGKCERYANSCGKCPLLKEYPTSLIFDHTSHMLEVKKRCMINWSRAVYISPSSWLDEKSKISFLEDSNRLIIHNGIDTSLYQIASDISIYEKYHIPANKRIILSVAPNIFSELKGGNRFLEIAQKSLGNESMHFIAVGATDNIPNLVPANVTILPLIKDKKELIALYSISDCFVICSQNENFPTTSLEAQCCGTKVVGYDVGGVKETILEGNGYVVQFNDVEGAAKCIKKVLDENYSKDEVSKKAKKYFSSKRMFDEYNEIYNKLCN